MLKIFKFFSKISRWILPAAVVILIFVVLSEPSLGAEEKKTLGKTFSDMTASGIMELFSFIILVITLIAYVFAIIVGDLIDSTYILDSGMGDTLHLIWSVMRNFVNVGFILVLLVIAAMVVFGGGGEKGLGMLKKVLPKFILALIFVNLTFFAGRLVLTTNDVLTTAIITLPKTVSGGKMLKLPCPEESTKEKCYKTISALVEETWTADPTGSGDTKSKVAAQVKKLQERTYLHRVGDMIDKKNIVLILLTNMLDLGSLTQTKGVIGGGWDMALSGFMALVAAGAIAIIIFMLVIALVVRMVVLWICLAVSPVAALMMVLGEVIPGAKMSGDMDLLSIFIKHAFMPTLVAIPLSIGLIMIFANNTVDFDYKLNTLFSYSGASDAGNFHSFLWWIASIAIIWVGTNAMIKHSSKWASAATDKIHQGVNKFVGAAAGTLKYAPIMPAWTGGTLSGIMRQPEIMQAHFREKSEKMAQSASPFASESYKNESEVNQFSDSPTETNLQERILKNSEVARHLLEGTGSGANSSRYKFSGGMGYSPDQIKAVGGSEENGITAAQLNQLLQQAPDQKKFNNYDSGKEIKKALEDSAKKPATPEATKKETVEKTGVNSKVAGERVEKNKVSGADKTKITINNRPVFKKDDKYYFADDDKDIKNGATVAFAENDLQRYLADLKLDIREAKDAKEADALGKRIKKAIDTFGDKATEQLKGLEFDNSKVKEALNRRLEKEHQLSENVRKDLGVK